RVGAVEQGRVRGDTESPAERLLDPLDRLVVDPVAADRLVVLLAQAVEMHAEREVPGRREDPGLQFFLQENGVGAEIDVLVSRDQLHDQTTDVGIHERLAAGNRYHRRAALLDRGEALLDRQVLSQNLRRILDLAAARAGEIASEQRLEHEDERITLAAGELL